MDFSQILIYALRFMMVIPAIILHEMAHGYAALYCGDDTAKRAGRLSLNPAVHIDLWGTVLMPIILLIGSGGSFAFGYAKPVPINPWRFKNEREGMLITGIAGPAANVALAVIAGVIIRILVLMPFTGNTTGAIVISVIGYFCQINLVLVFFNLIPIPPLDGSRVLQRFLPNNLREQYHLLERYGFMIVIGIMILLPQVLQTYFSWTVYPIFRLLTGL